MLRQNSPSRKAWSGFAFETLCIKHVRPLKAALGIAVVETSDVPWRYQAGKDAAYPDGAQIDLLIDRSDATINLCEIKFSQGEFTVDASYAKELRRKIDVFRQVTNTRKNIFLTIPVMFIEKIKDFKQPAVKIGLCAGDVIWKYGDWSFPADFAAEQAKGTKNDKILAAVIQAFQNENNQRSGERVSMTVLRNGHPIEILVPPLSGQSLGINISGRQVPLATFGRWKSIILRGLTSRRFPQSKKNVGELLAASGIKSTLKYCEESSAQPDAPLLVAGLLIL